MLELLILPTEQCNFRCFYCYEKFTPGKMNRELIEAIKILIKKRASELDYLQIDWFGGEPLLAKDIILEISSYILSLTKEMPKLKVYSGMSTNGYLLTLKTAEQLIANRVTEFQITLDGPSSYHDKVRKKKNGNGTFSQIWKNLLDLKSSSLQFKINLRIHFSKDNLEILDEFVDVLKTTFANDNRFRIHFKSLAPFGGENDSLLRCFGKEEAKTIKDNLDARIGKQIPILNELGSNYICPAGRPSFFIIRCDGRLAKCTIGLDDPKNQIGYLKNDGTFEINQNKIQPWFKGALTLNREHLRCPRSYL